MVMVGKAGACLASAAPGTTPSGCWVSCLAPESPLAVVVFAWRWTAVWCPWMVGNTCGVLNYLVVTPPATPLIDGEIDGGK